MAGLNGTTSQIDWDAIHAISTVQEAERRGLTFTKDATRWKACCPFHNDKTASFTVYQDNGWKCFGCDAKGGDVAAFIAQLDKISPVEAARKLLGPDHVRTIISTEERAERAASDAQASAQREADTAATRSAIEKRLIPLNHAAAAPAKAYLDRRHLTGCPPSVMFDPAEIAVVGRMVAPTDGALRSLACTYIRKDGSNRDDPAEAGKKKKHKRHKGGASKGACVVCDAAPGADPDVLVHVEGWENGQAQHQTPGCGYAFRAWCGSIPNEAPDPSKLNVIAFDADFNPDNLPDDPEERAKAEARQAKREAQFAEWQAKGLRVVLATVEPTPELPRGYDLNDLLMDDYGPDKLAALLNAAIASAPKALPVSHTKVAPNGLDHDNSAISKEQADETGDKPDAVAAGAAEGAEKPPTKPAETPKSKTEPPPPLRLVWLDEIEPVLTAQDYVQGVLTENGLTVVYGDSNTGKTFWTTDLSLHIAAGKEWNGRRVDQGGVVYCVLEGGNGFRNRVSAWKAANPDVGKLPFAAISSSLNLLDPDADTSRLITAIKDATKKGGFKVSTVVVDTLSRALAGGAENSPEDMGALVINADKIRAETGAALIFIHHSGKDAAKGARGHSLLRAAVDTEIEITETTGARSATVVKQRDLPKIDAIGFRLETVKLGTNQHGEDVSTCIVWPADAQASKPRTERKLADNAALLLRALQNLDPKLSEPVRPHPDMPIVPAVRRLSLRSELIAQGWFNEDMLCADKKLEKSGHTKESNALTQLKRRNFINFNPEWIWLVQS